MKKNKNLFISLTALGLLTLTTVSPLSTVVKADDTAPKAASQITSNATLKFEAPKDNTHSTSPVDPTNPGKYPTDGKPADPGDPDNKGNSSNGGPLSLDFAPGFDFGVGTITNEQKAYTLSGALYSDSNSSDKTTRTHQPFTQVTDNRGTGAGWTLSVSLGNDGNFINGASSEKALQGATIDIAPLSTQSNPDGVYAALGSLSQSPQGFTGTKRLSSQSTTLITAGSQQGMGTFIQRLDPDKIILTVQGGTALANATYNATMNWTLSAGPSTPSTPSTSSTPSGNSGSAAS